MRPASPPPPSAKLRWQTLPGATPEHRHRYRVTIIIVNHNGWGHLDQALASLQQDNKTAYEVIVVDNASSDGSAEHVATCYPEVRLIRSGKNLGFGAANNHAARQARGEYLAFLNPDTKVETGWLEPLIRALEVYPRAGMVTAQVLLMHTPDQINTCGNDMHLTGFTLCRGASARRESYAERAEVAAVSGAAFAMRRSLFEALGGFDESFFLYMEDSDLSLRARLAGYRCLYVPDSVVYHDYRLHFGPQKTYYHERNRYAMLLKTFHWSTLLFMAPALALGEIVAWGFVLLYEPLRLGNKLRAYAWVVRRWRQIMRDRQQTQRLRRTSDRDLLHSCTHKLDYGQVCRGPASQVAGWVFDPLFYLLCRLVLGLVPWQGLGRGHQRLAAQSRGPDGRC
ncbi:MAG: glycosyltransferase family 2 protein [Anaerolineae bacterium]